MRKSKCGFSLIKDIFRLESSKPPITCHIINLIPVGKKKKIDKNAKN